MKFTQVITRASLAIAALLNLSLATSAIAEPIVVTRGPNGAAHVVQSDNVPIDAKLQPNTAARAFPNLVQKGPGGAFHITNEPQPSRSTRRAVNPRIIQRGPNGAAFISNK